MPGTSHSGGRNKKSLRAHALAGTGRKNRGTKATATAAAADPPPGRPRVPSWMKGYALTEWHRMVARLEAAKTLTTIDDAALYQYCSLFAETEDLRDARALNLRLVTKLEKTIDRLRQDDEIAEVASAIAQLRKLDAKHAQQLRQGHMAIRQYLVEFGMTPAARGRVQVPEQLPPEDPFAEFDSPAGPPHLKH